MLGPTTEKTTYKPDSVDVFHIGRDWLNGSKMKESHNTEKKMCSGDIFWDLDSSGGFSRKITILFFSPLLAMPTACGSSWTRNWSLTTPVTWAREISQTAFEKNTTTLPLKIQLPFDSAIACLFEISQTSPASSLPGSTADGLQTWTETSTLLGLQPASPSCGFWTCQSPELCEPTP